MKNGFLNTGWNKTIFAQSIVLGARKRLINRFLDSNVLIQFLSAQCRADEITFAKVEIIQRDLKQLADNGYQKLSTYRNIVESVKLAQSEEPARLNESLFFKEIERVLCKYVNLNKQLPIWN